MLVNFAPLVRYVAHKVGQGLPAMVDQADLESYGMFGLIDAVEKFEPARGFKFETYAIARIKGNILDELRAIDWVPRSVRAKAREIERATVELEAKLNRSPTDVEVAELLDVDVAVIHNARSRTASSYVASLDEHTGGSGSADSDDGSATTVGGSVADRRSDPPQTVLGIGDIVEHLADAMVLPAERERVVLTLYYLEGLTLAQIGEVIGVTESRVCQIHTKAILQLRAHIEPSERHTSGASIIQSRRRGATASSQRTGPRRARVPADSVR